MDSSKRHEPLSGVFALLALTCVVVGGTAGAGCQGGDGTGFMTGTVWAEECGIDGELYDLRPNFFAQDQWRFTSTIRMQRGSNYADLSDGLTVAIADIDAVVASLGTPIPIDPDGPVYMTVNLGSICPAGRRGTGRRATPVTYEAISGDITFDALYRVGGEDLQTAATFSAVFVGGGGAGDPGERAEFDGAFDFLFQRGRPAQRFP